jgi:hypothetical protein
MGSRPGSSSSSRNGSGGVGGSGDDWFENNEMDNSSGGGSADGGASGYGMFGPLTPDEEVAVKAEKAKALNLPAAVKCYSRKEGLS